MTRLGHTTAVTIELHSLVKPGPYLDLLVAPFDYRHVCEDSYISFSGA